MKRILTTPILLVALLAWGCGDSLWAQATDAGDFMLRLETRDGRMYDIRMAKFNSIWCKEQEMRVSYASGKLETHESTEGGVQEREGEVTVTVGADDGARLSFQNVPATGIQEVQGTKGEGKSDGAVKISMTSSDELHVSGLHSDDRVAVYSLGGQEAGADIRRSASEATVNLHSLPRGTYLVSVNGSTTLKVMKR